MDQNTVAAGEAEFDPARERTTLVNALAEAARAALDFDFMSAAVLGAIPGTEPQQYVIAGTPDGISKMLQAIAAPSPVSEAQAERVPGGTAEQQARYAIDGAIQYGRENRNPPPSAEHWLYEYWNIGQQLRELGKTGWDNITPLAAPTAKEAEQASAQAAPQATLLAGAKMANTMFNLAQRAGDVIDGDLAALFDSMRKEWDAAVRAAPSGAQAAVAEVRGAALEEAATICDNNICQTCWNAENCAEDIRALRSAVGTGEQA